MAASRSSRLNDDDCQPQPQGEPPGKLLKLGHQAALQASLKSEAEAGTHTLEFFSTPQAIPVCSQD